MSFFSLLAFCKGSDFINDAATYDVVSTANIENRLQMLILRATHTSYTPGDGLST